MVLNVIENQSIFMIISAFLVYHWNIFQVKTFEFNVFFEDELLS